VQNPVNAVKVGIHAVAAHGEVFPVVIPPQKIQGMSRKSPEAPHPTSQVMAARANEITNLKKI